MDPNQQQPAPVAPEQPNQQPVQAATQPTVSPAPSPVAAPVQPLATAEKPGKWQTSKSLLHSSWRVLMLDKELMWLPILSALAALVVTVGIIIMVSTSSTIVPDGSGGTMLSGPFIDGGPLAIAFYAVIYLLTTFIGNYFAAALIAGAFERFNGGNPTVKSALAAARAHIGPLFLFSLLTSTVGYILQTIEERVPLVGKIAVWLVGAAWSIASMFSVAVIVTSAKNVGPIDATKQSVGIIKRTWGENVILTIGIGLASAIAVMAYIAVSAVVWAAAVAASATSYLALPLALLTLAGFIALVFVMSMLGAIVKAAIFYYASTGRAPQEFEARLLQASFTAKKARNIFAA